jgi:competence CoiA-like predicted nuclease
MDGECGCDYVDPEQRAESHEHRIGKRGVANARAKQLREDGIHGFEIVFERAFPSVRRIADVCVVYQGDWTEVHEIQCSYLSADELEARVRDYWSAGADVWLWFSDDLGVANRQAIAKAESMGVPTGSFSVGPVGSSSV